MVLEVEGVLLGTNNLSLVPLMAPFPSMGGNVTRDGYPCRYAPLVGAFHAHNLTITVRLVPVLLSRVWQHKRVLEYLSRYGIR